MSIPHPFTEGPDGAPVRMDRPMTDEEVAQSLGEPTEPADPEVADALETEATSADGFTTALPTRLAEVIHLLEPLDLETAIKAIEEEPLPGEPAGRRAAAMNRADRAELVRAFLALRETGRAIVRRLEDDAEGKARDE